MSLISQREIIAAYHRGDDIHKIIQQRARWMALAGVSLVTPLCFIGLYIIKSLIGIDIFPDAHLMDFLP